MVDFLPDAHTVFLTLAGSHAHGTDREGSDVDLRGVGIAPLALRLSYRENFEQFEGDLSDGLAARIHSRLEVRCPGRKDSNVETTVFDIAKFIRLCAAANPNTLEILFADPKDWLLESPAWRAVWDQRHLFLSRKVQQTYLGYALAQLKKIKTHRVWLLNPPGKKPMRADFGLPAGATLNADDRNRIEEAITAKLRSWSIEELEVPKAARIALAARMTDFWSDVLAADHQDDLQEQLRMTAAESLGVSKPLLAVLNRERSFRAAQKHWESYQRWKAERNPVRARLEARFGYDTKHAMHLIRLMRTGLELVETGELRVRRPDASELSAIRDGALTYEEVIREARELENRMEAALSSSPLPPVADEQKIDHLLFRIITRFSMPA
ncbi:MAG: DNA polymerase beta superfamily protein [Desulfococcaceae bacterium]